MRSGSEIRRGLASRDASRLPTRGQMIWVHAIRTGCMLNWENHERRKSGRQVAHVVAGGFSHVRMRQPSEAQTAFVVGPTCLGWQAGEHLKNHTSCCVPERIAISKASNHLSLASLDFSFSRRCFVLVHITISSTRHGCIIEKARRSQTHDEPAASAAAFRLTI